MHDAPLRPALWQSLTAGAASHIQSLHRGWQWGEHEFLPDVIDTEDVVLILFLLESRTSLRNLLAGRVGTPCSLDCRRRFVCSVLAVACFLRLCFPSQNTLDEPVAVLLLVCTCREGGIVTHKAEKSADASTHKSQAAGAAVQKKWCLSE